MRSPDFIVIGTGPGGSCVAAGLAERLPEAHVLVLERGEDHASYPQTLGARTVTQTHALRHLLEEEWSSPQRGLGGRQLLIKMGHLAGGTQPFTGGTYMRGARTDFAGWPVGWRWDDLVPWFEAIEARLRISRFETNSLSDALMAAGASHGLPNRDGFLSGDARGIGRPESQFDFATADAPRATAYLNILKPATARARNLTVTTSVVVKRVLVDSQRACGVELADGRTIRLAADGEVIVCGGAVNSPRLLLRSGIGPPAELMRHGIRVAHENEHVGRHLCDQLGVPVLWLTRRTLGGCGIPKTMAWTSIGPQSENIDLQIYFQDCNCDPRSLLTLVHFGPPWLLRLVSNATGRFFDLTGAARWLLGRLLLALPTTGCAVFGGQVSLDGIHLGAGSEAHIDTLTEGVLLSRALLRAAAVHGGHGGVELNTRGLRSRGDVARFVRRNASSVWHLTSSCRMAETAEHGVVDTRLRVHGLKGLRVVDASVLPTNTCGGTTAPIMAVGLRAAHLIADERHAAAVEGPPGRPSEASRARDRALS